MGLGMATDKVTDDGVWGGGAGKSRLIGLKPRGMFDHPEFWNFELRDTISYQNEYRSWTFHHTYARRDGGDRTEIGRY